MNAYVIPAHNLAKARPAPISFDAARAEATREGIADAPNPSNAASMAHAVLRDASVGAVGEVVCALHDAASVDAGKGAAHPQIDDRAACDVGGSLE